MNAANVGDEIDFMHQVETRAGRRDLPAVVARIQGHAQAFQHVRDGRSRQVKPQDLRDALVAQMQ